MQDYNALQRDKALLASLFSRLCHFFVVFFYFVTAGKKLSFEGTLLWEGLENSETWIFLNFPVKYLLSQTENASFIIWMPPPGKELQSLRDLSANKFLLSTGSVGMTALRKLESQAAPECCPYMFTLYSSFPLQTKSGTFCLVCLNKYSWGTNAGTFLGVQPG